MKTKLAALTLALLSPALSIASTVVCDVSAIAKDTLNWHKIDSVTLGMISPNQYTQSFGKKLNGTQNFYINVSIADSVPNQTTSAFIELSKDGYRYFGKMVLDAQGSIENGLVVTSYENGLSVFCKRQK